VTSAHEGEHEETTGVLTIVQADDFINGRSKSIYILDELDNQGETLLSSFLASAVQPFGRERKFGFVGVPKAKSLPSLPVAVTLRQ
jgi:hypothetical protein